MANWAVSGVALTVPVPKTVMVDFFEKGLGIRAVMLEGVKK